MKQAFPSLSRKDERRLNEALAALIANTRRGKRKLTLVEFVEYLRVAEKLLGNLRKVAERISLSEEMVRQFTRVEKLSPPVRRLAASGELSSVDIADRLSRLPTDDQLMVARGILAGKLTPYDLRAILALRKTTPRTPIRKIIDRIISSRNIRVYLAEFVVPEPPVPDSIIMGRISRALGRGHVKRVETSGRFGRVVLDDEGKIALEQSARKERITKWELLHRLVRGEVR